MTSWNNRGCWAIRFLWGSDPAPFVDRTAAPAKTEPNERAVRLSEPAALPAQQRASLSGHISYRMHGAIALALAALTASSSSAQDFVIPAGPPVGQQTMSNVGDHGVNEV